MASGDYSIAIGNNATVKYNNSVALGASSEADRDNSVAVGSKTFNRQITGVAAGEKDNDAVNYKQLSDVETQVADNRKAIAELTTSSIVASKDHVKFGNALSGDVYKDSQGNMVLTLDVDKYGYMQFEDMSRENLTVNVSHNGFRAFDSNENGDYEVFMNERELNINNGKNAVSITATGIDMGGSKIINVAAGTADTDAVNYAQLKDTIKSAVGDNKVGEDVKTSSIALGHANEITGEKSTAVGNSNIVSGERSTAVGYANTIMGNRSGVFGDPSYITGDDSYAIGNNNTINGNKNFVLGNNVNVSADVDNSVVLGNDSTVSESNVVSVGRPGAERKIVNVAPGTADTDAVNVRQLKEYSGRAGANAAALAALKFQPMSKGESQVAVGVGGYLGKKATALGFAYQLNDRVNGSVAGTINGKEHMYNLGFSYLFGQHSNKPVAQTVVPGSMTLKEAELQSQVDSLKADNAVMKAENAAMKARLDRSDAEIAELKSMVLALANK